jgi:hypothetical protein
VRQWSQVTRPEPLQPIHRSRRAGTGGFPTTPDVSRTGGTGSFLALADAVDEAFQLFALLPDRASSSRHRTARRVGVHDPGHVARSMAGGLSRCDRRQNTRKRPNGIGDVVHALASLSDATLTRAQPFREWLLSGRVTLAPPNVWASAVRVFPLCNHCVGVERLAGPRA